MPWYELTSADDPKLDELAAKYHLHPLHIEDARSKDERIKVDQTPNYTFAVLKPIRPAEKGSGETVAFSTLDIFAGRHEGESFFITIAEPTCAATDQALERARRDGEDDKPARLLYLILDTIVDLYFPAIDAMDDEIDDRNRVIQAQLLDLMQEKPEVSDQALNAILVSRNLERAADHATNIAEDVIFWVRGSDVRHKLHLVEAD